MSACKIQVLIYKIKLEMKTEIRTALRLPPSRMAELGLVTWAFAASAELVTAAPDRPVFGTGMELVGMVPIEVEAAPPAGGAPPLEAAPPLGGAVFPTVAAVLEAVVPGAPPAVVVAPAAVVPGGAAAPVNACAFFRYASKDLAAFALTAKTIPA